MQPLQLLSFPQFEDNAQVVIGGVITSVRQVLLRTGRNQGKKMGIITIEDLKGKVEVTLSPPELDRYRAVVRPDAIVFVRGTVSKRREDPSVRCNEVIPAGSAPIQLTNCLVLRFSEAVDSEQSIEDALAVCRKHSGGIPVYLEVMTADNRIVVIRCDNKLGVTLSHESLMDFAAVRGEHRVICTGPRRREIPWSSTRARFDIHHENMQEEILPLA